MVRGHLAEFLVSRAVGGAPARVEWDAYDVLAPNGVRIEVKAIAHVQAWPQSRPSRIVFTGLASRAWVEGHGWSEDIAHHADLYVFCWQTAETADLYDPLDVGQWRFFLLPAAEVAATGCASLGLATVRRLAGDGVPFDALGAAVTDAGRRLRCAGRDGSSN